ncbi:MAG: exodeoxyribonuclease VII small subunit [Bacteroides sp.]|jgi:exodeoxyribonuclease VII small subunit|nr:exodeoxyribonuclease VII small subunit [Bacteroides sp.]MBQ5818968.1 exodeoxyribonuclease VII small subunit [Bacteroides sp.]MBR6539305.1 exodeoxyribonuclease VII small subunit [Bacteroides sp.]
MGNKQLTYSEAIARLDEIVQLIDNNEVEIDQLADKIKEANKLIAFCSEKLTKAEKEMENLLAEKQETDK